MKLEPGSQNLMPECSLDVALLRLKNWRLGGDSFSCHLFQLMCKADMGNIERLRKGFPVHHAAWSMWQHTPNEDEFLESIKEPRP